MSETVTAPPEPRSEVAVNPHTGRPAGALQAIVLLFASTMPVMGAVLLAPTLPTLSKIFPQQAHLVPLLLTAPALTVAVTAPFAGAVADRIGRKRLLVGALVVYGVLGTAPLYLHSFAGILVSRLGVGMTEGAIFTCCISLLSDYFSGAKRGRIFAWQNLVLSSGSLLYLILGGLTGSIGWRAPFWLYATAFVVAVAVGLLVWRPRKEEDVREHPTQVQLPPFPFRRLLPVYVMTFFGGIVFYSVIIETPYLLVAAGTASVAVAGFIGALNQAGQAAGGFTFRWLARYGVHRLLPIGFSVSTFGLLMIWFSGAIAVTVVGTVFVTLGAGLFITTLQTWTVAGLPFEQRGRASGGFTSSVFLGSFFSALVVLGLSSLFGGLPVALGVLGIATAVLAVVLAVLLPRRSQSSLVDND